MGERKGEAEHGKRQRAAIDERVGAAISAQHGAGGGQRQQGEIDEKQADERNHRGRSG